MKLKNSTYDILKIIALIILPLSELIGSLANIWGIPYGSQIVATLVAVDAFLGVLLKISTDNYHKDLDTGDAEKEGGVDV